MATVYAVVISKGSTELARMLTQRSQNGWEAFSIHHEPSTGGYVAFIAKADDGTDVAQPEPDDE